MEILVACRHFCRLDLAMLLLAIGIAISAEFIEGQVETQGTSDATPYITFAVDGDGHVTRGQGRAGEKERDTINEQDEPRDTLGEPSTSADAGSSDHKDSRRRGSDEDEESKKQGKTDEEEGEDEDGHTLRPEGGSDGFLPRHRDEAGVAAPRAESVTAECLRYHNLFRVDQLEDSALEPLQGHDGMDAYVVALLERVAASDCTTRDIPQNIPFGINFYAYSGSKPSCVGATHLWYRGIDNFHGRYPGTDWQRGSANQFVQMMWSSSEYIACARTRDCAQGMNQLMCLYYPSGNTVGEAPFSENAWYALLERHRRWKQYDQPGGRRDRRPRAAASHGEVKEN
ncbi:hypothetical protein BESB_021660 [Besnoitia besnoiti]|uniref:SCP domain-containing protein n=1 Tax=Besnoitia besnoiti TaxID=94643 RepID=A0A2A9M2M9_BESBE|nr:hypothetical protein BESB_021660 [Besnoitia besnoiti]PFH32225.1 hypothetical protein BESB_021660 [Besnoitia besnoiti]